MRKRIGEFLVEKGVLTPTQVELILKHGHETGLRFGEAAMDLGVLTREQMIDVFGPSFAVDFFHVDAEYFPKITQDLLPVETMVRLGVLPLGFKTEKKWFRTRRLLNLGVLDPERKEAAGEALRAAAAKPGVGEVQGTKVFLVLADQFLQVLARVYQVDEARLRAMDPAAVDPTLMMFLENAK
jgi:hypothetical protein